MQIESLAGMDPLMIRSLTPGLITSSDLRARWASMMDAANKYDGLVMHGLGNRFSGGILGAGGVEGRTTCAMIFFEDTVLPDATKICDDYALVVSGSSWCEDVLRANGVTNVYTVIQGVDLSVCNPWTARRYACGPLCGSQRWQNRSIARPRILVIQAFAPFARRHPEAILSRLGGRHGQPLQRRSIATR